MSLPMYCIWRVRAPCGRIPCAATTASCSASGRCSWVRWPGDSATSCAPSACNACASRLRWLLLVLASASALGAVGVSVCLGISPGLSPGGLLGALPRVCGHGIGSPSMAWTCLCAARAHALQFHHQTVCGTFLWYLMDVRQHFPAHMRQNDAFRSKVVLVGAELRVI